MLVLLAKVKQTLNFAFISLVLLWSSVLYAGTVTADSRDYPAPSKTDLHFETIDHGETSKQVSDILHDSKGFLWVGTNSGLNRFNGISFDIYQRSNNPASLADDFVGSLYEDRNQNLWIGGRSVVSRYCRETDTFHRYMLPAIPDSLASNNEVVNSIQEDQDGTIWVTGGSNGLYYLNPETDDFQAYEPLINHNINGVLPDGEGGIWITTADDGLQYLEPETGHISRYYHEKRDEDGEQKTIVKTSLLRDRDGSMWLATLNNGISRVTRNEDGDVSFQTYRNEAGGPKVMGNNMPVALHLDRDGDFWVGNDNGGLHLYDRENDRFHYFTSDPHDTRTLSHHSVISIHQDHEGRLWVGTAFAGLNVADPYAHKFEHHHTASRFSHNLTNNIIRDFLEDEQGNIWVGTDGGGLNYFNRQTGRFSALRHDPDDPRSLSSDAVVMMEWGPDGRVWVGSYDGGIDVLVNPEQGHFEPFEELLDLQDISINHPFHIHFDREHPWLWIAEFHQGVVRLNLETGDANLIETITEDGAPLLMNYTVRFFEDSDNNLWIGSSRGLTLLKSENKTDNIFQRFTADENNPSSLVDSGVRQITEDHRGWIWVATEGGLSRYLPETGGFKNYTTSDGLVDNNLQSVIEDDYGNLWIGTKSGLSRFDPEMETFENFGREDGLQGYEFSRFSNHKLSSGELLIGGLDGFNLFHPEYLQANPHIPPVHFTNFRLFNEPVLPNEPDSPLDKHIMVTDTLTLTHRQNILTFEYIALNYTMAEQNRYAFMMEGFETDWNYVGNQRNATYMNLDPGTYRFRVKASNNDGYWNEAGASVVLRIIPPFWQTNWFYTLVILFIILVVFTGYRIKISGIRRKNQQLEEMVKQRTSDLRKSNEQLNEHIGEKNKIYSVLAHDLRNPFMSLIGLSEHLKDELEETSNQEHAQIAGSILDASQSTYNLLENILQWSSESQNGKKEADKEAVDMKKVADEAIAMTRLQAKMKNVAIHNNVNKPVYAHADPNMLLTVLRNLVTNAIKFSHKDDTVSIDVEVDQSRVITSVSDQGVGMDEAQQKQLFSAASSGNKKGTMGEKGSGFGLMVCREFVERNGGSIEVESTEGVGSTFRFTLEKAGD